MSGLGHRGNESVPLTAIGEQASALRGRIGDRRFTLVLSSPLRSGCDVAGVFRRLRARFGLRTLLLEGGGRISASFLAADAIDELSILLAPVADGSIGTPSLFDARNGAGPARHVELPCVERRRGDLVMRRLC